MYGENNYMGEEEVTEEDFYKGDYFLQIQGDSMTGSGIMDGDLALIKQCSYASTGDIAVVMIGGEEVTVKRIIKKPDMLILKPQTHLLKIDIFLMKKLNNFLFVSLVKSFIQKLIFKQKISFMF